MAKCTVLPPTERPLLLAPSTSGSLPSQIRSPVQYSFCWCVSSDAKSSSGRHHGPASKPTTVKPSSASRQARVPPPAPVPTTAKSTASSSRYSRIGTQPPTRNGSGARPPLPRGTSCGSSDAGIVPARLRLAAGRRLRLPGIAAVELHPHIAARARRAAETDLVPRRRVAVIGGDDVEHEPLGEEQRRRHALPVAGDAPLLHRAQQRILLGGVELGKAGIVPASRLSLDAGEAAAPRLAQRRQAVVAVTVAAVGVKLVVDHRGDGHRRPPGRL